MIKHLAACVREYKKHSILSPLFVSLEVLMECYIPLLTAALIDDGIEMGDMPVILRYGGILIAIALLSLCFGALSGRSAAIASAGFAKNLRRDIFYAVQDFSFGNIDKFSSSSLVTRMTTDVSNIQNAFMMIIRIAVRSPIMLIFSLIMAFRINRELSILFLIAIPVLGIGLYLIMSNAHPIFERVFKTYDKLNSVVQENLHGIRVVKSFVREDHERKKFTNISESIFKDFSKAERILAFNNPLMMIIIQSMMVLICWLGARIIISSGGSELSTGELTGMITYAMQVLMSLMMFSMVLVTIVISKASAVRITEVLSEKSSIESPAAPVTEVPDGSIRFENVSFSYFGNGGRQSLSDIDIEISSGETVGILGGTGSSKTTLVQLIPRLYDATGGRVLVGGNDVRDYDLNALRTSVAMVLQKNTLFSGTVRDNLLWGNEHATDDEIRQACSLAQADGFVSEMPDGYDTWIEQGGINVSGGQKQRLCIARALLKKPKILILDDSTSAVDTRTDALIRQGFREYIPETTKLIIAQRISSVQDADRIIVMDNGRIAAFGTHNELLKNCAIYREVYDSQVNGGDSE